MIKCLFDQLQFTLTKPTRALISDQEFILKVRGFAINNRRKFQAAGFSRYNCVDFVKGALNAAGGYYKKGN